LTQLYDVGPYHAWTLNSLEMCLAFIAETESLAASNLRVSDNLSGMLTEKGVPRYL